VSTSNGNSLASMTRPPLAERQIWLPGGNPEAKDQREIKSLDDSTVTYVIITDKGRHVEKNDTLQRFLLWILQSKAQEIGTIYATKDPEVILG